MKIKTVLKRFTTISQERSELNRKIAEHYEPLLKEAGNTKDFETMEKLLSELPDCPFALTAYRMQAMYKDNAAY